MHLAHHELLSQAPDALRHRAECAACRAAADELLLLRRELAALPLLAPPPGVRARVLAGAAAPQAPIVRRGGGSQWFALAASIGVVAFALLASTRIAVEPSAPATASIGTPSALERRNAELEHLLASMPRREVVSGRTGYAIAMLEQELAHVDSQLTYAAATPVAPEATEDLWAQRVQLMDSLVRVSYAAAVMPQ